VRLLESFTAGEAKRFHIAGQFFCFDSVPGGSVDAAFYRDGRKLYEDLTGVIGGWSAAPLGGFDSVEVTSSLTQAVSFYVARGALRSSAVAVINFPAVQAVTGPLTDAQLRAAAVPVSGPLTDAQLRAAAVPVSGPLTDALLRAFASNLWITATAAVNTAVTATLPAAGAGQFHYITSIELVKAYSVVGVAAGAGVTITSTNMPGGPAWTTEQLASPAGTRVKVIQHAPCLPLKSLVANTATTFVAGAQLQTIWRWNISYYTGP
jgi:hypothetical protein